MFARHLVANARLVQYQELVIIFIDALIRTYLRYRAREIARLAHQMWFTPVEKRENLLFMFE